MPLRAHTIRALSLKVTPLTPLGQSVLYYDIFYHLCHGLSIGLGEKLTKLLLIIEEKVSYVFNLHLLSTCFAASIISSKNISTPKNREILINGIINGDTFSGIA